MIKTLSVQNYKSLADVTLALRPLNVLVGPNASGKSSVLQALSLARSLLTVRKRLGEILAPHGGFQGVVWGGDTTRDITLDIAWGDTKPETDEFSYHVRFGLHEGNLAIKQERVHTAADLDLVREQPDSWALMSNGQAQVTSGGGGAWDVGVVPQYGPAQTRGAIEPVQHWSFHQFDPRAMRPPQDIRREYVLNETGSNLSTVVHTLFSEGNPAVGAIEETLRGFLPNVTRLLSPVTEDGKTYAALVELGVPSPVGTWGMSDGSLFALALAVALQTPQVATFIGLESPENDLHPYLMEAVAEMLVTASRKTQVFVTTHSPYLLNYVPIESLIVAEKRNGQTRLSSIKNRRGLAKLAMELGLGKAWYAGHLGGVP